MNQINIFILQRINTAFDIPYGVGIFLTFAVIDFIRMPNHPLGVGTARDFFVGGL